MRSMVEGQRRRVIAPPSVLRAAISQSLRDREDFSTIVIPDLIRDPLRRRGYRTRIKSGMTNAE